MWPSGSTQNHTSVHAGGTTRPRRRSIVSRIAQRRAVDVEVDEAAPAPPPAVAGRAVVDVDQTRTRGSSRRSSSLAVPGGVSPPHGAEIPRTACAYTPRARIGRAVQREGRTHVDPRAATRTLPVALLSDRSAAAAVMLLGFGGCDDDSPASPATSSNGQVGVPGTGVDVTGGGGNEHRAVCEHQPRRPPTRRTRTPAAAVAVRPHRAPTP